MRGRTLSEPVEYQEFARARAHHLFRIAYLMCGDWHEAQDLVQVCLGKVYVSWDRIQRHEAVDAYARKILLRTYLSERRRRRYRETVISDVPETGTLDVDHHLRMALLAALRELPPRNRAVVVLRYLEDCSLETTAELLRTTPSAVKSLNTRSLAQLRQILGNDQASLFGQ
jgi:RNA polymerase sigma-70 factor (sigma-E family)